MAKPTSVDAYLAAQPAAARAVLAKVRAALRKALPEAEEVISYQIPALRADGRVVLFFAGWKDHYALYPASPAVMAAFEDELDDCEVSKGTIRFPWSRAPSAKLLGAIARVRAAEVASQAAKRGPVKAKRRAVTAKKAAANARGA